VATNQNVLWGDYFYIDPSQNYASGDALVHIEASTTDPLTATPNNYTFYGAIDSTAWNAEDRREPLGSTSVARFLNGGVFNGGTQLLVWRDGRAKQNPFTCGVPPAGLPQQEIVAFDEQEQGQALNGLMPFPARSQKVTVNGPTLPVTPQFGWLYLNLKHGLGGGPVFTDPYSAQSFVSNEMDAAGRFSVGQSAIVLENAGSAGSRCLVSGSSVISGICQ